MTEEKRIALYYASILYNTKMSKSYRENFIDWATEHAPEIFDEKLYTNDVNDEYFVDDDDDEKALISKHNKSHKNEKNLGLLLKAVKAPKRLSCTGKTYKKANMICDALGIHDIDREIIRLSVFIKEFETIRDLIKSVEKKDFDINLISWLLQKPINSVKQALGDQSPLIKKGLLEFSYRSNYSKTNILNKVLISPCRNYNEIRRVVLDEKAKTKLSKKDFQHVENELNFLIKILTKCFEKKELGVNIMLYGPPGTGKTEFSKVLCKELKADLYMLSENADDLKNKSRLTELRLAQSLTKDDKNTVLLLDEAEDVFYGSDTASKMYVNRALEKNQTPVIWISNNIRWMDPAYLRRYTYAIEFPEPPESVRESLWKNIAKKNKYKLSIKKAKEYAKKYEIAPSFINRAIRSAALLDDESAIDKTIQSLKKAITGKDFTKNETDKNKKKYNGEYNTNFNTDILNTDIDLKKLAMSLKNKETKRFSLCLFGAAGTGKSEYARYLANELKLPIIHKRASDLISKYVGETEQNIAEVFKQAKEKKSLLIFDEADSFLQDRSLAQRTWEVSSVNEMLTWMENHPYPFICTTNLMESLDKASLRRFTFKVKYDYLKSEQVQKAFKHFFNKDANLGELINLGHLAPGDFMVVKNKAEILEIENRFDLIEMLQSEQEAKGIITKPKIGF